MKKALSLAIIASLVAVPALAGETFVRNVRIDRTTKTDTNLNIETITKSTRIEYYDSFANKTYLGNGGIINSVTDISYTKIDYDPSNSFSWHHSGSSLRGKFIEDNLTKVWGTIKSYSEENYTSHETTAGVR
jgi:hypothetical protein